MDRLADEERKSGDAKHWRAATAARGVIGTVNGITQYAASCERLGLLSVSLQSLSRHRQRPAYQTRRKLH